MHFTSSLLVLQSGHLHGQVSPVAGFLVVVSILGCATIYGNERKLEFLIQKYHAGCGLGKGNRQR